MLIDVLGIHFGVVLSRKAISGATGCPLDVHIADGNFLERNVQSPWRSL